MSTLQHLAATKLILFGLASEGAHHNQHAYTAARCLYLVIGSVSFLYQKILIVNFVSFY